MNDMNAGIFSKTRKEGRFFSPSAAGPPGRVGGFTLVETLVAIAILAVGVAGPLVIVSQSITVARLARDQLTAINLAQEAIEFIRHKRDTTDLEVVSNQNDWLFKVRDCVPRSRLVENYFNTGCIVDTFYLSGTSDQQYGKIRPLFPNCSQPQCEDLWRTSITASTPVIYGHCFLSSCSISGDSVSRSPFKRWAVINEINGNEAELTVTVSWQSAPAVTRSVVLKEYLTNWLP